MIFTLSEALNISGRVKKHFILTTLLEKTATVKWLVSCGLLADYLGFWWKYKNMKLTGSSQCLIRYFQRCRQIPGEESVECRWDHLSSNSSNFVSETMNCRSMTWVLGSRPFFGLINRAKANLRRETSSSPCSLMLGSVRNCSTE